MIPSLLKKILGSIATRMGLVLLTMAAVTFFVGFISINMFERTKTKLDNLISSNLPEMSISASVPSETNTLTSAVFDMLDATDKQQLEDAFARATGALDRLNDATARSNSQDIKNFTIYIEDVRVGMSQTHTTLLSAIEADGALTQRSNELVEISNRLIPLVLKETKAAENALRISSSRTQRNAASNINALLEGDIAIMALMFEAKALVTQLSGAYLVLTQATNADLISELRTSTGNSLPALVDVIGRIENHKTAAIDTSSLNAAVSLFQRTRTIDARNASTLQPDLIANQRAVETQLDAKIEALKASSSAQATSTAQTTSDDIKTLLQGASARASALHNVESMVERFVSGTLDVAQAQDIEELKAAQRKQGQLHQKMRLLARKIVQIEVREAETIAKDLKLLMGFSDPKTGIGHETETAIVTHAQAEEESKKVREIVNNMLSQSFHNGEKIVEAITSESNVLRADTAGASREIQSIVACSALLLVVAVLLTLRWILLPIRRITQSTHRLSQGDLAEVTGFERAGGEIGAMASALAVFRDSLVENERRAAEESERQENALRQEQKRMQDEQDMQRREEAAIREANEEKQHEKALREKEREESRRVKEEEARQLAEEQRLIVTQLAQGLKRLARGDLQVQVETPFAKVYEPLRLDFNQTVRHLSEVVSKIANSEHSINSSTNAIAARTDQLSRRTQKGAETLADIASSLGVMTERVQGASDRADTALSLVNEAHGCSDRGRKIVAETVDAMREIEEFSKRVSQITGVIDEIAFQTNLLALNAGVEAARAGSSGRGFAVVATEVRELALRSSSAAGEINTLISGSTLKVKEGARLVEETRSALEEIDTSVGALAGEAEQIASASKDQANRITSINLSVSELDTLTQQNAIMSQETQTALQTMLTDSQALTETVAEFQMSEKTEDRMPPSAA